MNLEQIKGLGPSTIVKLNKLNIFTIEDLITYYPYKYNIYTPNALEETETPINVNVKVISLPRVYYIRRNLTKLSFNASYKNKIVNVVIFNRHFLKPQLTIDKDICIVGKYNKLKNVFIANDILLEPLTSMKIEPKYHLIESLKNNQLQKNIKIAITDYKAETLPQEYVEKHKLINNNLALNFIHNPSTLEEVKMAKTRIVYEELFNYMFKINYLKAKLTSEERTITKAVEESELRNFLNKLPFELTEDQKKAIYDIKEDFQEKKRMNRLVLGDVGSGKTIVAFAALFMNMEAGYQGAFMAPTEVLAEQHFKEAKKYFNQEKIRILTGSTSKKEKKEIQELLKEGLINIVIGTHALIEKEVEFNNLGLVITDEQHRFGVNQRKNLQNKGDLVDVIYMSATPIPRTLALTIYGDMEISEIKTKPKGRKEIKTKVYKFNELKEVLKNCLEELKQNHQIYVVAPLIEGEEDNNSVQELEQKFNIAFQNKIKIDTLHGKKNSKEKNDIIEKFKNNETKILISTTVIEVGIDVKNATTIIIFNAERFGLATLHQLRGRVGRNDVQSYCYLISDKETERLKVLEESNDGFYISEKDFEIRGSGDLFGTEQSGEKVFKMANLKRDYQILKTANMDSQDFIAKNLNANFQEYQYYQEVVNKLNFID